MTTTIASVDAPLVLFTSKSKSPEARFANDIVVTTGSDHTPEYYLEAPPKSASFVWDLTLRAGGREGRPVCVVRKEPPEPGFKIALSNDAVVDVTESSSFFGGSSHPFVGVDGTTQYEWRPKSLFFSGGALVCIKLDGGKTMSDSPVVASWDPKNWALLKEGTLQINSAFAQEKDLLVATALAIEEWLH
ncbi:hypothetical protein JCM5296_003010 [Sporobolomyces johnsonii]